MGRKPKLKPLDFNAQAKNDLHEITEKLTKAMEEVNTLKKKKSDLEQKIFEREFEHFSTYLKLHHLSIAEAENIITEYLNTVNGDTSNGNIPLDNSNSTLGSSEDI